MLVREKADTKAFEFSSLKGIVRISFVIAKDNEMKMIPVGPSGFSGLTNNLSAFHEISNLDSARANRSFFKMTIFCHLTKSVTNIYEVHAVTKFWIITPHIIFITESFHASTLRG